MEKKTILTPQKRYWLLATFFLMISAFLLTWLLEYRHWVNDAASAFYFMDTKTRVFAFTTLLMFIMLAFLTGLTRKPVVAVGIMWGTILVVTYIHINKYAMRGTPLLPEDFMLADQVSSLTSFVDVWSILRLILALIIIAVLTFFIDRWVTKRFKLNEHRKAKSWWKRHAVISRSLIIVVSAISFMALTNFVRHNSGQRSEEIPWLNTHFTAWNQTVNYNDNGFLLGFLYNLEKLEIEAPNGYSEEKMAEIKAKYSEIAEEENQNRVSVADEDVSIVVILNESFYDPSVEIDGISALDYYPYEGGELLPNLHKVQSEFASGSMYSTDFGGGTANIEFEAFTGLTNYWINSVPYTSLVPKSGIILSMPNYLKSNGYETTAVHPYNGGMYKRNLSLPNLGYDTFITELDIAYTDKEGHSSYINDSSAYRQVLDVLNSTDENQIVGLITMQNHAPYGSTYEESEREFKSSGGEIEEARVAALEDYYESLHKSDQYLGEFIEALDGMNKKVVVLFFGDHASGPLDYINGNDDKTINTISRLTPYFIYNNFDYISEEGNELPTTTPNCLANTMFDYFNWQKPDYFYLVDEACEIEPILTQNWFGDNESPFQSTEISSYELLTYDLLGGEKYWMKDEDNT